jgi:hypothetical protein
MTEDPIDDARAAAAACSSTSSDVSRRLEAQATAGASNLVSANHRPPVVVPKMPCGPET